MMIVDFLHQIKVQTRRTVNENESVEILLEKQIFVYEVSSLSVADSHFHPLHRKKLKPKKA